MEADNGHSAIMLALGEAKGETKRGLDGIAHRLDTLNSSVAKHELRLASQDVLNAQMTLTQTQIIEEIKTIKGGESGMLEYINKTKGSISTFKWLFGFMGVGTFIIFLKVVLGFDVTSFLQ